MLTRFRTISDQHKILLTWKIHDYRWEVISYFQKIDLPTHFLPNPPLDFHYFTFMHWRRKWQPTPVFLPGESQGRGSLVGCCLWGRTESDTTEATQQQQQQQQQWLTARWTVYHCKQKTVCIMKYMLYSFRHWLGSSGELWSWKEGVPERSQKTAPA